MKDVTATEKNNQNAPTGGSVESAKLIKQLMENKGLSPDEAAAALAASQRMARRDPAAVVANDLLANVQALSMRFAEKAGKYEDDVSKAIDEQAAKVSKSKLIIVGQSAAQQQQPTGLASLPEEQRKELEQRGDDLQVELERLVEVEATALQAHIAMRREQREEMVWGEQSAAMAAAHQAADGKISIGFKSNAQHKKDDQRLAAQKQAAGPKR